MIKNDDHQKKSHTNNTVSTAIASLFEVLFFHPVDTIQKRLMINSKPIYESNDSIGKNVSSALNVALKNPISHQYSLYPGLSWALGYKTVQRVYKFGGQHILEEQIRPHVSSPGLSAAISGAVVGAFEVVLLPLDIFKIRKQTGSNDVGVSYRGTSATVARNILGSFTLFGVPHLIHSKLWPEKELSKTEKTASNFAAAASSVIVSSPFDVIKTRMQANGNSGGALTIATNILKENPSQFFKALMPKLSMQSTKVTFFLAMKDAIEEKLEKKDNLMTM
ncbi:MAG: MC/SLC25 family protein [Legionella sp.]|jgi:hypothetical protein